MSLKKENWDKAYEEENIIKTFAKLMSAFNFHLDLNCPKLE